MFYLSFVLCAGRMPRSAPDSMRLCDNEGVKSAAIVKTPYHGQECPRTIRQVSMVWNRHDRCVVICEFRRVIYVSKIESRRVAP